MRDRAPGGRGAPTTPCRTTFAPNDAACLINRGAGRCRRGGTSQQGRHVPPAPPGWRRERLRPRNRLASRRSARSRAGARPGPPSPTRRRLGRAASSRGSRTRSGGRRTEAPPRGPSPPKGWTTSVSPPRWRPAGTPRWRRPPSPRSSSSSLVEWWTAPPRPTDRRQLGPRAQGLMWGPWLADAVGEEPCRVLELQGIAGSSPAIDGASGLRNAIADQGNR